ncbi:MAG: NADH:ubiquinone reductase (Na(+)-transporting) subunit F [Acidobacteriaceae bacterium]
MSSTTTPAFSPANEFDYSLTGVNSTRAIEKGLAEADWYQCPVPRETMRKLLERRDGSAIRDTMIWFALILLSALATYALRHTLWAVIPYLGYCVLYASTSDSRWHESGHGTAFKTDWMNSALYEIASFMVMRESTVWRWSHTRHHSDTLIVGRDPEIAVPRPPDVIGIIMAFFNLKGYPRYFKHVLLHFGGRMSAEEKMYIPESEFPKIYFKARIYLLIYATAIALAIYTRSFLPVLFIGLPNLFGSWLLVIYGLTQHAGLAENVLDHRLNCRTIDMGIVNRFLYWNMNYHIEHHMFPLVPYHSLPALHAVVGDDCPPPYPSLFAAWREIVPTIARQIKDPSYHVKRRLPERKSRPKQSDRSSGIKQNADGWLEVCAVAELKQGDILRVDYGRKTYALYRTLEGQLYATDGMCTHANSHLADGLIVGNKIECSKHNGRFNLCDGSPARVPICRGLATYPVEERNDRVLIDVASPGGVGARASQTAEFRVVSNRNVATFIKELVLEPVNLLQPLSFTPGDYLQVEIPPYEEISFKTFEIPEPFAAVWRNNQLFDLKASNTQSSRRNNYSLASNLQTESTLRFNVRIATPPPGQDCAPGAGSSYVFSLKPGDRISAIGPFGDFHIKPTQREMVYIGGGAGMAPLRAHLSHLLETEHTARKVSFWYGARSRQELFYADYFNSLVESHPNFTFHLALSSPLPEDAWDGSVGFVHDVVLTEYLGHHSNPSALEYYLCGPPLMIKACTRMLEQLGVPSHQIAFDEF